MPTHRPFSAQLSCCALPSLRGAPAGERTGSHVRRLGGVGGWAWARERWSTDFSRRDALVSVRETALCGGKLHARAVGDLTTEVTVSRRET